MSKRCQVLESCFGRSSWPKEIPVPQAWLEFDVKDVRASTAELVALGYRVLVSARREPWGQTVSRLLSPEGLLVGVTHTPWLRATARSARAGASVKYRPLLGRASTGAPLGVCTCPTWPRRAGDP